MFETPYFKSRLSSLVLYFTIGCCFFIIIKNKKRYAILMLLSTFFLLYYFGSRSTSSILLVTLLLFISMEKVRLNLTSFYFSALVIALTSFIIFNHYYPEIITEVVMARIDTFSAIFHIVEKFPLGIGSGGIVDNSKPIEVLSSYYNFHTGDVHSASNDEYSTAHSLVFGSLLKNGLFASIPLYYLLFNIFNLNLKLILCKREASANRFLSIYMVSFMSYSILFSGYGQFLTQFPVLYAATIAMYRKP